MSTQLDERLRAVLDRALVAAGCGTVESARATGGGCIARTARVRTTSGADFFLKWSDGELPHGLFTEEARSLAAIAATNTLRVPEVVALEDATERAPAFLLLEWLEPGPANARTWAALGEGLARLHRPLAGEPGWPRDNFIGSLPQPNGAAGGWPAFWRERRLRPQLELALASGWFDRADVTRFEALFGALEELLAPARHDGASLLHGDLWSGNLHVLASGAPALIDPASYYGHREVDLAMTELFGGFDPRFYDAYRAAWPLAADHERRQPVYQLYYLLVHVNIFGGSYRAGTLAALRAAGF